MNSQDLLAKRKNIYSQNGEDGIIAEIFTQLNVKAGTCCEFGAWDGIHFSNTRNLMLNGWIGIQIEADPIKLEDLKKNYSGNPNVYPILSNVDDDQNTVEKILAKNNLQQYRNMDFISIDVDGLDYWIMKAMHIDPSVMCVEVNSANDPSNTNEIPRNISKNNVGQSLAVFTRAAEKLGYSLVCYTGNAFFIKKEKLAETKMKAADPLTAYTNFLSTLSRKQKRRMFFVNLGLVDKPSHKFNNPFLTRKKLGLSALEVVIVGSILRISTLLSTNRS